MNPGRLESLDVVRGATIAAMMIVNNPGTWDAVYPQLLHAEWNGWTFTDLYRRRWFVKIQREPRA